MKCILCSGTLKDFYIPPFEYTIASDCSVCSASPQIYSCSKCGHVQKFPNLQYQRDVEKIYQSYLSYTHSGGNEPLNHEGRIPISRSQTIIENIKPYLPSIVDSWLDVGAGDGVMLSAVSNKIDVNYLAAQDISDSQLSRLSQVAGLERIYVGELDKIEEKFDVISAVHVLEHVFDPVSFLQQLKGLLKPNGVILLQVPNVTSNPFDMLVYDHVSHFSIQSLRSLSSRVFEYSHYPPTQIGKEITMLVSSNPMGQALDTAVERDVVDTEQVNALFRCLKSISQPVSVFSCGPIGVLSGANLGGYLQSFVDEDTNKAGTEILGVPVILPRDVIKGIPVFLPLPVHQRNSILSRFKSLIFITPE